MLARLLLIFIAVPLVELTILIWLGARIGFWPTIGVILLTGFAGAWLAKSQGLTVIRAIQADLRAHRAPAERLLDGFMILVGGMALLAPGMLTDLLGLALLIPPVRRRMKASLRRRLDGVVRSGGTSLTMIVRSGGTVHHEDR